MINKLKNNGKELPIIIFKSTDGNIKIIRETPSIDKLKDIVNSAIE